MNDFSELEKDLKALRPAQPSPVLFERIEGAMAGNSRARVSDAGPIANWFWRFTEWSRGDASDIDGRLGRAREREQTSQTPYNWWSLGAGLAAAAAAVVLLIARISTNQTQNETTEIAQVSPPSQTRPALPSFSGRSGIDGSMSSNKFVSSGATQVVYNTRDEGLQFADGSQQPLRRLRYRTQQTWQWRNPSTGASLRVSYPSEEVVLIPVSGQ
jgi:hypothetical protein